MIRNVCVFCGSGLGNREIYDEEARRLGTGLAELGVAVVYGGGKKGLMGALGSAVTVAGGKLRGVTFSLIAEAEDFDFAAEDGHSIAGSPHERRTQMYEMSDAFITLPGGLGTLEELAETWCWAHLGLHDKPHWLVNVHGYFDGLVSFLERGTRDGFCREDDGDFLKVVASVEEALDEIRSRQGEAD